MPEFAYVLRVVSCAGEEGLERGGDECYFVLGGRFHFLWLRSDFACLLFV